MKIADLINSIRILNSEADFKEISQCSSSSYDIFGARSFPKIWFGNINFTKWVYNELIAGVNNNLELDITINGLIKGVLMNFFSRSTLYNTNVLYHGPIVYNDLPFIAKSKPGLNSIVCSYDNDSLRVPARAKNIALLKFEITNFDNLIKPKSISNVFFFASGDIPKAIVDLPALIPYLVKDSSFIIWGREDNVEQLISRVSHVDKFKVWARCTVEADYNDHDTRRYSFAYLSLPDPYHLSGPPPLKKAVDINNVISLFQPIIDNAGPYTFVERDNVRLIADEELIYEGQSRNITVKAPFVFSGACEPDALWRSQFGVDAKEWFDPGEVVCPPLLCFRFNNARIVGTGPVITDSNYVIECSLHPLTAQQFAWWAPVHNADLKYDNDGRAWSDRSKKIEYTVEEPVFLITDPGLPMHYHFLFDLLPRLHFRKGKYSNYSIAIPDIIKQYQLDALVNYYDIPREKIIIYPTHHGCTLFREVYITPTLVTDYWAAPEALIVPRSALSWASRPANSRYHNAKYIYVSRRNAVDRRRLVNEDGLYEALNSLGFIEIDPGQFSYAEEMYIFANADVIVGPFGSGMANIIFASPHARILLLQPNSTNWRILSFIMDFLRVDYGYVFGEAFNREGLGHNTEWIIDINHVIETVRKLL